MNLSVLKKIVVLAAAPFVAEMAEAETINWYCPLNSVNRTSADQPMDASFQFQLGVFSGGFVPTAGNIDQWSAHWVAADTASYNPTTNAYEENVAVSGNTAPFIVGAKAYVWGKSPGTQQDEWILFRATAWTWPAPNPMNPFPLAWNANQANEVILGSVNSGGALMRSAAVISYAQWKSANLAGEPLDGSNDDPDRDGVPNLLEFVFGTPPLVPSPSAVTPSLSSGFLQLSIPRLRNRLATLTVEVSENLAVWNSGAAFTAVVTDEPALLVVRDLTPSGPGHPRRFMRLKAVLQP